MVDMLGSDGVLAVPSAASVALPQGMDGPGLDECRQRAITIMSVAGLAGLPQVRDCAMFMPSDLKPLPEALPSDHFDHCPLSRLLSGGS